jgi:hypothetical protein
MAQRIAIGKNTQSLGAHLLSRVDAAMRIDSARVRCGAACHFTRLAQIKGGGFVPPPLAGCHTTVVDRAHRNQHTSAVLLRGMEADETAVQNNVRTGLREWILGKILFTIRAVLVGETTH